MKLPLSLYVVRTKLRNTDNQILFNTVTRKILPLDATSKELIDNHFVAGSEEEAIASHLTRKGQKSSFTIINTWECNLRCTHCTVSHKLVKKDKSELDSVKVAQFLKRFQDFYELPRIMMVFLGGEPLLKPEPIVDCINLTSDRQYYSSITTNLTVALTPELLSVLSKIDNIGVSIDGTEISHNSQRKPLTLTTDPFHTTIENLKTLVKLGYSKKISVQGAIPDAHLTNEHRNDFYRMMLKLGIPFDNIKFACLHPTVKKPEMFDGFSKTLKNHELRNEPCCKYRYHNYVIDIDGTIYADYYTWEKVGTIDDSIEDIDKSIKKIIFNMPALEDEKCQVCPAIGYCWGGCTNGEVVVGRKPSDFCDQRKLIKEINDKAIAGELI